MDRYHTGSELFNEFLDGGYETSTLNTVYGPSGTGKTCLCILAAGKIIDNGKKVVYIDTEGSFSIDRATQIYPWFRDRLDHLMFFKPTSFQQQHNVISKISAINLNNIGMIIVDSIAMFYRMEVAAKKEYHTVNQQLTYQILSLLKIAREHKIPVIITSQVYASLESRNKVNMVGGDIIKYSSKCIIELFKQNNVYNAKINRHRSIPEGRTCSFYIVDKGIQSTKPKSL